MRPNIFVSFLLLAGALLLPLSADGPAGLQPIEPGVYLYRDTCNVYAIVKDGRALLIDFGSGGILDKLPSIGVHAVDWILHTHFHRDQAQGDPLARARGVKIAVPAAERKYFDQVEEFWNTKKVFHLYDMRNEFFALRQNVPVDFNLKPGSEFEWNGIRLKVVATPGHTEGSLSFLYENAGRKLLFCGDLVASQGKIPTVHDLEWVYVGARGIEAEMDSLNRVLRDLEPDEMLPSHGSISSKPVAWTPALLARLANIYHRYNWIRSSQWRPGNGPVQLTKHIWQMRQFGMRGVGYVIVADTGRAFIWDMNAYEAPYLEDLRKRAGIKSVAVISNSHYHDDHTGGINIIKTAYGAKFWVMDHMVDVLQNPMAYNLPCLWHEPIHVDRVTHDGEKVDWDGIPMQFFYLPGQTEYTEGLLVEDEGKRYLFDGDNVSKPLPGAPLFGHFVCRNYQRLDGGHVYAAHKLLELKPDYVCPNHFEWSQAAPEVLASYRDTSEGMNADFRAVIDQPEAQIGIDNNWASFYPYQAEANPGDSISYQLRIRNWIYRSSRLEAAIRAPEGWTVAPPKLELDVPAKSESVARFVVTIPRSESRRNRRFVLTADLRRDGEPLGEVTEGLVNMKPMKAH